MNEAFELKSTDGRAVVRIDPQLGGRVSAFSIDGHQLLVPELEDPLMWGCYPMIPFAGRIRHGKLEFNGVEHQLPVAYGPHAMHGNGFTSAWDRRDDQTIGLRFSEPWPFDGDVVQRFELEDGRLQLTMTATAAEPQPMSMGWHPWFLREGANGEDAELDISAGAMYARDAEGLPSGELVSPPPGPWDDCFTRLARPPRLRWGSFELRLSSSADHWVVFDELSHALCVEPQTGPPNDANDAPRVVEAGESLTMTFTLEW